MQRRTCTHCFTFMFQIFPWHVCVDFFVLLQLSDWSWSKWDKGCRLKKKKKTRQTYTYNEFVAIKNTKEKKDEKNKNKSKNKKAWKSGGSGISDEQMICPFLFDTGPGNCLFGSILDAWECSFLSGQDFTCSKGSAWKREKGFCQVCTFPQMEWARWCMQLKSDNFSSMPHPPALPKQLLCC